MQMGEGGKVLVIVSMKDKFSSMSRLNVVALNALVFTSAHFVHMERESYLCVPVLIVGTQKA